MADGAPGQNSGGFENRVAALPVQDSQAGSNAAATAAGKGAGASEQRHTQGKDAAH